MNIESYPSGLEERPETSKADVELAKHGFVQALATTEEPAVIVETAPSNGC